MAGKRPDFYLKALNKATEERSGRIGAAWLNKDGSISLQLNLCVRLAHDPDIILRLFPADSEGKSHTTKFGGGGGGDDDIPF